MGLLESLLTKLGTQLFEMLWAKIAERLDIYFEMKSQIKAISTEADGLKEELKNATTDAERIQILRKITNFSERIGQ